MLGVLPDSGPGCAPNHLRLVTFNVKFAQHVDRAIALFDSTPSLRDADLVMLQEMDAAGTRQIAAALGLWYVYYPASVRPVSKQDFGNAILSRWPIVADRKVLLPHVGRIRAARRAAVAATIDVGGFDLRVYNVHLATQMEISPGGRRDQARAVLADAAGYAHVIVAGDMNSHGIGRLFADEGFAWPTRDQPVTTALFNWDHIFLRGVALTGSDGTGVVPDNHYASDHRPVWAVVATGAANSTRRVGSRGTACTPPGETARAAGAGRHPPDP